MLKLLLSGADNLSIGSGVVDLIFLLLAILFNFI